MPQKEVNRSVQVAAMQIKKYLDGHPYTQLSTAALARQYHLSRNALQDFFKEKYKQPIGQYKLKLRLGEAQRLLRMGKSVKEVSILLRYASPSSFSNAFKNYYDISATEWLNEVEGNSNKQVTE
jgi:AraC-like DNA-binding protein